MRAVHFIGFRCGRQWYNAVRIWGKPDFVHRHWDVRAAYGGERHPDDVLVFATGTDADTPRSPAFNDSFVKEDYQ